MKKDRYKGCESGKDHIQKALCHPEQKDVRWAGDHCTITTKKGRVTLAAGKYEYPPYVRKKIRAELVAIGLGLFILLPAGIVALGGI
jgi:hypothetical protein